METEPGVSTNHLPLSFVRVQEAPLSGFPSQVVVTDNGWTLPLVIDAQPTNRLEIETTMKPKDLIKLNLCLFSISIVDKQVLGLLSTQW